MNSTAPSSSGPRQLHLFISGLVQGVSFRANAQRMAHTLQLTGWVRNLADGRVELLAQGEEKNLKSLLAWAHHGPAQSRVDHVETHWVEHHAPVEGFHIQ